MQANQLKARSISVDHLMDHSPTTIGDRSPFPVFKQQLTFENLKQRQSCGIDKRIHKNGTVSYRARVRIKGHPVLSQSFASKTLAMKWKRDTESEVEKGKYEYAKLGSKNTLAELIDRYIEKVLPSKPKNARNVRQHLLSWKQELGHCLLFDIKPSMIAQKRDELLSGTTCKDKLHSSTTVVRYLASLSHAFAIAVKDWEWIQENPVMKISKPKISNGRTRFLNDDGKERLLQACQESEIPQTILNFAA